MDESAISVPEEIDAAQLKSLCAARRLHLALEVLETTASTNADALKNLRTSGGDVPCPPFAVFAKKQSAGRGRTGRRWESVPGHLYVSFGFAPKIPPAKMANFTLWMGVAICEMLNRNYSVPAQVKWPNDLHVNGKKLAGMLSEVHMDANCVQGVVFGIGVNVADNLDALPMPVREQATAVREHCTACEINVLAAELAETVSVAAERFFAGNFQGDFERLWARYDSLRDAPVTAIYNDEQIAGIACGITSGGSLRIRTAAGEMLTFSAGDVSKIRK